MQISVWDKEMKVLDQAKSDAIVTLEVGAVVYTFCSIMCRVDWFEGTGAEQATHMPLYGCWQCGEDLLQGMLLDGEEEDENIYRQRRQ